MENRATIQLEDFDALFNGASSEMEEMLFASGHNVQKSKYPVEEVLISAIEEFPNHPFKVTDDDEMEKLSESILSEGVLNPVIVRKCDGKYQMISGHRRLYACKKLGFSVIPARVMELSDDQATIIMIDANFLQRKSIRPSEKAKAYKQKYEAMKHQGRADGQGDTYDEIGRATSESGKTVQRFCQLCNLSDELLEMIDSKRLGTTAAFDLVYLSESDQEVLRDFLENTDIRIKKSLSVKIKEKAEAGGITEEDLYEIAESEDQNIKKRLNEGRIRAYFPTDFGIDEIEETIIDLLRKWKGDVNG